MAGIKEGSVMEGIFAMYCAAYLIDPKSGRSSTAIEGFINDLRVDTFRASGAGGQHVNKTDSAVRLTHIPTGIVVECQDGRSQHKNKEKALSLLRSKLMDSEREKQEAEQAESRKIMVGSGDRSAKIRTYNFSQNRITDHRIEFSVHNLEAFLDGDIDVMASALLEANQAKELANLEGA